MPIQPMKGMDLGKFRITRHVTRPLLKMTDNKEYAVKIEDKIFQAEQVKNPKMGPDGKPVPPPHILNVLDLEDGASKQMVANEVLKTELERTYKNDSYVGKYFLLVKNTKAEGKRYNTFGITEIEPEVEEATTQTEQKAQAKK